jgi:hypothetical protein
MDHKRKFAGTGERTSGTFDRVRTGISNLASHHRHKITEAKDKQNGCRYPISAQPPDDDVLWIREQMYGGPKRQDQTAHLQPFMERHQTIIL